MKLLLRNITFIILMILSFAVMEGKNPVVVADSITRLPLPNASVFNRHGRAIGMTDKKGRLPDITPENYPVTLSHLGFFNRTIRKAPLDTIFLQQNSATLPEVKFVSHNHKYLHLLAYVREYSTLTTYTDTVFLFREKTVDYMLPPEGKMKFKGWSNPRTLSSKSYYRFTDALGLDSVSDVSNHHFSWSDWVSIAPLTKLPPKLRGVESQTDTIRGKYSPTEIWIKQNDRVNVEVNVLADTTSRKWVSNLSSFFSDGLDFNSFKVSYDYKNVIGDSISPFDLSGYRFSIDSTGRGHKMFRFNKVNESFFVTTNAEIYILDREYLTPKEARKWATKNINLLAADLPEPYDTPQLQPDIKDLVARVDNIDRDQIKLGFTIDHRFLNTIPPQDNFTLGRRLMFILRDLTGISSLKFHRNQKKRQREANLRRLLDNNLRHKQSLTADSDSLIPDNN